MKNNHPSPAILTLRCYLDVSKKLLEVLSHEIEETSLNSVAALMKRRSQLIHAHGLALKQMNLTSPSDLQLGQALLLEIQQLDLQITPKLEDHRTKTLQKLLQLREEKERLDAIRKTLPHQAEQSEHYLLNKKA